MLMGNIPVDIELRGVFQSSSVPVPVFQTILPIIPHVRCGSERKLHPDFTGGKNLPSCCLANQLFVSKILLSAETMGTMFCNNNGTLEM